MMWLVRGQRDVVLWCDLWKDKFSHNSHNKELHHFVLSQITSQRTTSLCPLTSHITKNYISLSSHKSHQKELYLFVLSHSTTSLCSLTIHITKNYISLSSHKSHHKELHLFVLSQVTSLVRGQRDVVILFVMWLVREQRDVVLCDVTCERTKLCSSLWCELWEDKEM
jgi:hypothetical protein